MKKIIILFVLFINALIINAQWEKTVIDADELIGNSSYITYKYNSSAGSFIFWDNKSDQFRIITNNGIFNHTVTGLHHDFIGLNIIVGLYNENNELIEKFKMWLDAPNDKPTYLETRDAGYMSNPIGQKKKVQKILNHLRNSNGYIRIIAEIFGTTDNFDIKISKLNI